LASSTHSATREPRTDRCPGALGVWNIQSEGGVDKSEQLRHDIHRTGSLSIGGDGREFFGGLASLEVELRRAEDGEGADLGFVVWVGDAADVADGAAMGWVVGVEEEGERSDALAAPLLAA
jgi:hypothetical protein